MHDLEEIVEVADRVTVLRDGILIRHDKKLEDFNPTFLQEEMIVRPVIFSTRKRKPVAITFLKCATLSLRNLKADKLQSKTGEILELQD